jgi:hypothetical protein
MSVYPPPTEIVPIFNPLDYLKPDDALTIDYANLHYLKFPIAQGTQNMQDTNVNGLLTANANIKTNNITAIGITMDIGKSRMLGDLNVNGYVLNSVKDIFGESGQQLKITSDTGFPVSIPTGILNMYNGVIDYVSNITSQGVGTPLVISHTDFNGVMQFTINGNIICYIDIGGFNLNENGIIDCSLLSGKINENLGIEALGTGQIQMFAGGGNRLTFTQNGECVANSIGFKITGLSAATSKLALGYSSGQTQGNGAIAIGGSAGVSQTTDCIAIGRSSGLIQLDNSIAIGLIAGEVSQGVNSIALGVGAGRIQNNNCVAIGVSCGRNQSLNSIAIGGNAGFTGQLQGAIAIGFDAGKNSQNRAIAIGNSCAPTGQGIDGIAIGTTNCGNSQGARSITIGTGTGISTGTDTIAIGTGCATSGQLRESIAIGRSAGVTNQSLGWGADGDGSVAIGCISGATNQALQSIAIGGAAGNSSQASNCVAIGYASGSTNQQTKCIAIGSLAGQTSQKTGSIMIGANAGNTGGGQNSIYIGNLCGSTSTQASSILLSSTGSAYNPTPTGAPGFFVNPGNVATGVNIALSMNTTTGEITRASSSLRYKKDVTELTKDSTVIHRLVPKEFRYLNEDTPKSKNYGFIAEELDLIDSDLVAYNENAEPEGIYWEKINTYNICEVQKLRIELNSVLNDMILMRAEMLLMREEINLLKNV